MIKTGHLGRVELFSLVVIASVANVFLSYPQQLVLFGGPAGWVVPLVSCAVVLVVWWLIQPIFRRLDSMSSLQLMKRTMGTLGSSAVLLITSIYLLLDGASTMRMFTETVITTVLPRSPISFVAVPFAIVIVYFAYMGPEALTRVAWFLFPLLMGGLLLLLVLNGNWMNNDYLLPLLGKGPLALLKGGGIVTGVFVNVPILLSLAAHLRKAPDAARIGFWSILVVGLTYSIVTLCLVMVFPPEAAMRAPFPLYQLGRLIYVGRFVQRLEAAFVFIWVAMAVIKISAHLWVSAYLLAEMCNMPVYRPLVFPMVMILYSLSFLTRSFPQTLDLYNRYLMSWAWVLVIAMPLLIVLWMRWRLAKGKGGRPDEQAPKAS